MLFFSILKKKKIIVKQQICFLEQRITMISEGSCDAENWLKIQLCITGRKKNIFKHNQLENSYFKL